MTQETKTFNKFAARDIVFLCILVLQDAGTFGVLPINLAQILVLLLGFVLISESIINPQKYQILSSKRIFILIIILFIAYIGHSFDFDSITSIVYFLLELCIFFLYFAHSSSISDIFHVIIIAAFILASYGIIQQIAFQRGVASIYDLSRYGFAESGDFISQSGVARVRSFYAEPAHLSGIFSAALVLCFARKQLNIPAVSRIIPLTIFICAILTQSSVVYLSIAGFMAIILLLTDRKKSTKIVLAIGLVVVLILIPRLQMGYVNNTLEKLSTLQTANSNSSDDLSAFAIISNLRIAVEKMKDGYLFGTGFDTHRIYYYRYINSMYSSILMYLNQTDAGSLIIRIFSEFGVVGVLISIWFMLRKFAHYISAHDVMGIFFAVMLVFSGIRNGHYEYVTTALPFTYLLCERSIKQVLAQSIQNSHS